MLKHDNLLSEKYFRMRPEHRKGRPVLANLPERTERESRLIRQVFSSYHCRLCGECCRGFSFSSDERNYRDIALKIELNLARFTMKVRGQVGNAAVFRADPAFSSKCGFFERKSDMREVPPEIVEAGGDLCEEGAPFGCGIYNTEPGVCSMFPVSAGIIENPGNGAFLAKNAMHITAECRPIFELFTQGIGHILGREIIEFWPKGEAAWINFGTSLAKAVAGVSGLIMSGEIEGFHFVSERGEHVFPIKRAGFPPGSSG